MHVLSNMHKIYSYSTSVRLLSHLRSVKFISNCYFRCPIAIESPRSTCCSMYRVICTDTNHQVHSRVQPNHGLTIEQEALCYYSPFLKENFNIVDNRYFKLISDSNEYYLVELLKKEEFKDILSRSSFTFDVDLSHTTKYDGLPVTAVSIYSFEDICKNSSSDFMEKQSSEVFQGHVWYSKSTANENNTGKPTEQQLLYVIDRLTYSLLNFFEKPQDYSLYHKNIIFQNNIRGVSTKGLTAYIQTMYILKFYGLFHFAKVKVEILKITHHNEDGTVRVRWRVNGVSRHRLLIHIWKSKKFKLPQYLQEETEWLDGFSTFSVGTDGLIYKHTCDKLTPSHEVTKPKKSLKSKILGLIELTQRGPAGSLNALMSCYRNQIFPNCKKIT